VSATTHLAAIILSWGLYGLIHSWLAGTAMKMRLTQRWPGLENSYRLLFNLQATLLALPPLILTWFYPGAALWHWPGWIAWPALLITVAGFLWSMRWYDGMDFLGLRRHDPDSGYRETLILSPLHRYVRHPWYSLGLLYLWTRDLNAGWLAASIAITIYLVIGSRLEERKLAAQFGEPYRRYLARVPGLIPLPGRCLSRQEQADLVRSNQSD
jgi:protein-S-isoprenylcysteine O-methyltransferase Ste14